MTFLLCDPGWCVHKSHVQHKWDDNAHAWRSLCSVQFSSVLAGTLLALLHPSQNSHSRNQWAVRLRSGGISIRSDLLCRYSREITSGHLLHRLVLIVLGLDLYFDRFFLKVLNNLELYITIELIFFVDSSLMPFIFKLMPFMDKSGVSPVKRLKFDNLLIMILCVLKPFFFFNSPGLRQDMKFLLLFKQHCSTGALLYFFFFFFLSSHL